MKAGLVVYGSLATVSGGYLYDRLLADRLRGRGVDVEVLSLSAGNYWRHLASSLSDALPRSVNALAPDLLLEDELCHPSLFLANRRLRKTMGFPVIPIVHHLLSSEVRPPWQNRLYRFVEKLYLETADGFIFNSETTRAAVRGVLGRDIPSVVSLPGRDHVTPHVSEGMIVERCRRPGPLRILFIGNVIPRKGLHTLLDALYRLPRESCELTVAGSLSADVPYARRIRKLVSGAGLAGRVKLLDMVSPDRLADLLASHHCLAVPSYYEGYGIVYLEAMGFGEPIIASTAGAVPEVIGDGREGFLSAPGDASAVAAIVGRLGADRGLLLSMSLAARERYLRQPTWEEGAVQVADFLRRMIEQKKSPGRKGGRP